LRQRSPVQSLAIGLSIGILVGVLVGPGRQAVEIVETPAVGDALEPTDGATTANPTDPATGASPTPGATADGGVPEPIIAGPSTPGGSNPAAGPSATEAPVGNVTGVTTDTIRIGIGVPDLGVLAALGPNYDFGDPADHMNALLEDWRERGLVPVHGRDLVFYPRRYDIVGTEQQLAACQGWINDDKVFAVVAVQQFWGHGECVAESRTPLITTMMYYADTYTPAGARYIFDLEPTTERVLRNWVHWMDDNGILQGKTIGVYRPIGRDGIPITDAMIPELNKLGYEVAVEVTTDNHSTGSGQDTVAVSRFRRNVPPVDLALLMTSAINSTNFMQQAQAQAYRPTYVMSDYIQSTNDVAASTFPPDQFDGSFAMTMLRYGEEAAGLGLTPQAQACVDNYAERRGRRVSYRERPAEYLMLVAGCDEGSVLLRGLQEAGRGVTVDRFVDILNTIRDMPMGLHADVSFVAGDPGGVRQLRTLQWRRGCTCYVAVSDWRPFYVN
jgi:hypothetical protein